MFICLFDSDFCIIYYFMALDLIWILYTFTHARSFFGDQSSRLLSLSSVKSDTRLIFHTFYIGKHFLINFFSPDICVSRHLC